MQQDRERSLAYHLSIIQKNFTEMSTEELVMVSGARGIGGREVYGTGDGQDPKGTDFALFLGSTFLLNSDATK